MNVHNALWRCSAFHDLNANSFILLAFYCLRQRVSSISQKKNILTKAPKNAKTLKQTPNSANASENSSEERVEIFSAKAAENGSYRIFIIFMELLCFLRN